jgi:F-type H+-transporting ATPase subunit a
MIFLIVCAAIATKGISMIPTKAQNFFEIVISSMEEFMVDITGEEGRWFFPIICTLFLYIAVCNLCGLIPGFFPPTASINTTLSCAVPVFIFTHYIGVKYHGAKYVKHFLGPVWWMSPLILVIELIGHFARIMSLSFRLFGNIMGHELVLMILFMLAGAFLRRCRSWPWGFSSHSCRPLCFSCCRLCILPVQWNTHTDPRISGPCDR